MCPNNRPMSPSWANTATTCKRNHEQPRALADTLDGWATPSNQPVYEAPALFADIDNAVIHHACGTSYHAGLVAKYWLESWPGCHQVEVASEYRYRDSVANPAALVVTISQSGETADTLAAPGMKALGHDKTLSASATCRKAR